MIISKAIELLNSHYQDQHPRFDPDTENAIKLLIEAGKRIEDVRLHPFHPIYNPLPGESMPERDILTVFREPKKVFIPSRRRNLEPPG